MSRTHSHSRRTATPSSPFSFILFIFLFLLFRAAPAAYGGSQAGVESELQLPAYATATAIQDLSHVCDLHHSSRQHLILNPPSEARNQSLNLTVPSRIPFHCATMGTPSLSSFRGCVSLAKQLGLKASGGSSERWELSRFPAGCGEE